MVQDKSDKFMMTRILNSLDGGSVYEEHTRGGRGATALAAA